jgi:anthranilate phosphoribosyltransferase
VPIFDGSDARPVVIPAYGGASRQRNLTPLLALLLQRLRVPVLIHGTLEGNGRIATAYVFRELGIMPCMTLAQASASLDRYGLAFVPTGVIAPGLAQVMSLRKRTGVTGLCQAMAALIDPFQGAGLRIVTAEAARDHERLRELLLASGQSALFMAGTEGEAFADPRRRPRLELIGDGAAMMLFEQEHAHDEAPEVLSADISPRATAAYIRQVLEASSALPQPMANQLSCCLYAAGHAADFNQAKAIVAVATRSLAMV